MHWVGPFAPPPRLHRLLLELEGVRRGRRLRLRESVRRVTHRDGVSTHGAAAPMDWSLEVRLIFFVADDIRLAIVPTSDAIDFSLVFLHRPILGLSTSRDPVLLALPLQVQVRQALIQVNKPLLLDGSPVVEVDAPAPLLLASRGKPIEEAALIADEACTRLTTRSRFLGFRPVLGKEAMVGVHRGQQSQHPRSVWRVLQDLSGATLERSLNLGATAALVTHRCNKLDSDLTLGWGISAVKQSDL